MDRLSNREAVTVEPKEFWNCDISTVADIAQHRFSNGNVDDPWSLAPIYFRPSAAEEVRAQKIK